MVMFQLMKRNVVQCLIIQFYVCVVLWLSVIIFNMLQPKVKIFTSPYFVYFLINVVKNVTTVYTQREHAFFIKANGKLSYPRTKFTFSFTCTHVAFKNHFVSVCTTRNLIKWTLRPRVWKLLTIYHHQFIHVRTSLLSAANIFQQAFQWRPVLLILAKNFWIISENEQNVKDEYLSMSFPDYFDSIDYLFICPVDVN